MQLYKKDFWSEENLKYLKVHFRMERAACLVNRLARNRQCDLLDVGCGPATLQELISPKICYYGIDIAIHEPSTNLIEMDFLESPIRFDDKKFDLIVAQGVFEYVGDYQEQKFAEIRRLLKPNGRFVASYINFGHRGKYVYPPYSNVQSIAEFRTSLSRQFRVENFFPTSHNWNHAAPNRSLVKALQKYANVNIPFVSSKLAVEYFFICSA